MTAQHEEEQPDVQPAPESTDPLGPIQVPTRSKIGARAMALAGAVGLSALAAVTAAETCSTWTTIEHVTGV
jgi:hypothetical protein